MTTSTTAPRAHFIAATDPTQPAVLLRRHFTLDNGHGRIQRADLRLSALGVVEAFINGEAVSQDVLTPGWSSYEWRVRYVDYDVTELVTHSGTVGLAVGNGWYRGRLGWGEGAPPYGDQIGAYAELRIVFADGHEQVIVTDETWSSAAGSVLANDLYDGQTIDARRADPDWATPSGTDQGWSSVQVLETDLDILEPDVGPPIRRQQELAPTRIFTSPSGATLVDFGQNLVGWVRVRVTGREGTVLTLRHAEVLEDGEIGMRPLRTAKATDTFVLSGGEDTFEPTFTFHGFRYVEVTGWPDHFPLDEGAFTAVVVGSELERTGFFQCSNPLLNQLHENVVWSLRGNFVGIPTDCPQRDERLGWTGDLAVFAPTATYLYDVKDFLRDWLRDLALEQAHNDGIVPVIIPNPLKRVEIPGMPPLDATAIWGDAAVWVPWSSYQAYGDAEVLEDAFDSIAAHVRRVESQLSADGLWVGSFQFGDWLDPDADPAQPWAAKADPGVVATASAYRTARMAAQAAGVLGREEERAEFDNLAGRLRSAFRTHYVHDERVTSDCTTVYALAIVFELLETDEYKWAGSRLAELVEASGYKVSTGFAGTPFITEALSSTGHLNAAYKLLLQEQSPSWLYPVTMGATTIWERWDSMLPDGSINAGEMTSFNHYAFGSIADWMHRVIGGISPLEPGYRRILIAPQPGGDLTWAESALTTPHGEVRVHWNRTDTNFCARITVPPGTSAVVRLPDGRGEVILWPGSHTL